MNLESGASIEAFLGSPRHRYFGAGYRRTRYEIPEICFPDAAGDVAYTAASVTYPVDWSIKAGMPRQPHLSTVDAIVLTAWLAQSYLTAIGVAEDDLPCAWISEISVRAGSRPVESLERVPVRIREASTEPTRSTKTRSTLRIDVGTLSVIVAIEHAAAALPRLPRGAWMDGQQTRPDAFTSLFTKVDHHATITRLTADEIACNLNLRYPDDTDSGPRGLAAAFWPTPTFIDSVVLGGQMAEVLSFMRTSRDRDSSATMWMRRIHLLSALPSTQVPDRASARLMKSTEFQREGVEYLVFDMDATILGIHMSGAFVEMNSGERRFRESAG